MASKLGAKILARSKDRLRREDVTDLVPEWKDDLGGARIFVRAMTGMERDAWEAERSPLAYDEDGKLQQSVNSRNIRARGVSRVLVDEAGERLFPDPDELGQAEDGDVLNRLYEAFLRVSGLVKKAKGDTLPNAPGGGSSIASPNDSAGAPSAGDSATSTPAN